jgi:hypothetical protein
LVVLLDEHLNISKELVVELEQWQPIAPYYQVKGDDLGLGGRMRRSVVLLGLRR